MKKEKLKPVIVQAREGFHALIAEVVSHKLEYAALTAEMELEVAAVQARYQTRLADIGWHIECGEAGAQVWAERNRAEFGDKKSIDLVTATVGFRTTPHRVEKVSSKETWGKIALKLQALVWGDAYVRDPEPEVNKQQLLADRATLTEDQLKAAGIRFEQDENFFIEPKSQVAQASVREAA